MAELARVLRNFQITLPKKLRGRFRLKQGEMVRLSCQPEGILISPVETIDRSQAWFMTEEWQEGEKEVDREIKREKIKRFDNLDDFLKDLKK